MSANAAASAVSNWQHIRTPKGVLVALMNDEDLGLRPSHLRTLAAVYGFLSGNETARPTLGQLARITGMCEKTVSRDIQRLKAAGALDYDHEHRTDPATGLTRTLLKFRNVWGAGRNKDEDATPFYTGTLRFSQYRELSPSRKGWLYLLTTVLQENGTRWTWRSLLKKLPRFGLTTLREAIGDLVEAGFLERQEITSVITGRVVGMVLKAVPYEQLCQRWSDPFQAFARQESERDVAQAGAALAYVVGLTSFRMGTDPSEALEAHQAALGQPSSTEALKLLGTLAGCTFLSTDFARKATREKVAVYQEAARRLREGEYSFLTAALGSRKLSRAIDRGVGDGLVSVPTLWMEAFLVPWYKTGQALAALQSGEEYAQPSGAMISGLPRAPRLFERMEDHDLDALGVLAEMSPTEPMELPARVRAVAAVKRFVSGR